MNTATTPPNDGGIDSPSRFTLRGDAVGCACPSCGSALSVVVTGPSAECGRCRVSVPLAPEQASRARELLERFERSLKTRAAYASVTGEPPRKHRRPGASEPRVVIVKRRRGGPPSEAVPPAPFETPVATYPPAAAGREPAIEPGAAPASGPVRVRRLANAPASMTAPEAVPAPVRPIAPRDAARPAAGLSGDATQERFDFLAETPSWLISAVVHLLVVVVLGLIYLTAETRREPISLLGSMDEATPATPAESAPAFDEETPEFESPADEPAPEPPVDARAAEAVAEAAAAPPAEVTEVPVTFAPSLVPAAPDSSPERLSDPAETSGPERESSSGGPAAAGGIAAPGGFGGRVRARTREQLVEEYGGTEESETAVARGLRWLAAVQEQDGSWSPQKWDGVPVPAAGTGLGVLPFLGAGQTHLDGEYRRTVYKALHWLLARQRADGGFNTDLFGRMYDHGVCTIALCEAYGLSRDPELKRPAQKAVNFIVAAQDPQGGGWRYSPRTAGDMSVFGWQVMALRSAQLAYLDVPESTMKNAIRFIDGCDASLGKDGYRGDRYAYLPGTGQSLNMTAEAMLCRQYTGWKHTSPAMHSAVRWMVGENLPNRDSYDLYYVYYGTQVTHHFGGEPWKRWNERVRDALVASQVKEGPLAGSWDRDRGQLSLGGRICSTSISLLTLEVYYRHLPIYDRPRADVQSDD